MREMKKRKLSLVLLILTVVGLPSHAAAATFAAKDGSEWTRRTSHEGSTVLLATKTQLPTRTSWTPEDRVLRFLSTNEARLGLVATRLSVERSTSSPFGTIVELGETVAGQLVLGSYARAVVGPRGELRHVVFRVLSVEPEDARGREYDSALLERVALAQVPEVGVQGEAFISHRQIGIDVASGAPAERLVVSDDLGPLLMATLRQADARVTDLRSLRWSADVQGLVFNPNPINTMNDRSLMDLGDDCNAVAVGAYFQATVAADDPVGGVYSLSGRFARIIDDVAPSDPPVTADAFDGFEFCRDESGFEDFNAYYWISASGEYVESLGHVLLNGPVWVDAHADVATGPVVLSFPLSLVEPGEPAVVMALTDRWVTPLRTWSVDAGEDADIVLHEHSHVLFHGLRPVAFCKGGEPSAINEGSADYWAAAATWNTSVDNGFDPDCLGEWFEAGTGRPCTRRTDELKTYPVDMVGQSHADGEIWSAFLVDLAFAVGSFDVVNRLLLGAVEIAPDAPSFRDMVDAMLDAETLLYGGVYAGDITGTANPRGLLLQRTPEVSSSLSAYPLRVAKAASGQVTIYWEDLGSRVETYNVYDGEIGRFTAEPPGSVFSAPLCNVTGDVGPAGYRRVTGTPSYANAFFLVTANANGLEGPSGYMEHPWACIEREPREGSCTP